MAETSSGIVELVRGIVEPLAADDLPAVDDVDAVEVTSTFTNDGCELVEIRVAADDAGKVIGRQGRVIKSIRVLARAAACGNGNAVEVELVEG